MILVASHILYGKRHSFATFLHVAVGYWEVRFHAEGQLVTSLVLTQKKTLSIINRSSKAHRKLWKVKLIIFNRLSPEASEDRNTHISVSFALVHEIRSCTGHMVSSGANTLFYILCSAALHTLKHYALALSEGKQDTHSFLWKRKMELSAFSFSSTRGKMI